MARGKKTEENGNASTISLIGPGMRVDGDCVTEGTLRVEGTVEGTIYAGKAVVVGQDGRVDGDIRTQDAVISGGIRGSVHVASRLELQATAQIEGTVHTRRLQLEEGAVLNGDVRMGEVDLGPPPAPEGDEGPGDAPEKSPADEGHREQ